MSKRGKSHRPLPLNQNALRQHVRVAIERGYYAESFPAESERPERNLSIDDVIHGLERRDWTLEGQPNYDEGHEAWEYLIRTVDVEGTELHIKIAATPSNKRIEIITRW
jgi:hypothetical protein